MSALTPDQISRHPGGAAGVRRTPDKLALARAIAVVSGGPLTLAAASVLAPVAAARRWPRRASRPATRRAGWTATMSALVLPWAYGLAVRPRLRTWGATSDERSRAYPGDVDDALSTTTRAVAVRAPAEDVWRWLVQVGQDRGGFYSYDWLENLAGCRLRSADRLHEEWQHPEPGDPLFLFPGFATALEAVDPPRSLLIRNWGAYVVEPLDDHSCRLVARSHADRGPAGWAYVLLVELPHAIMERKMLLGIKSRAEAAQTQAGNERP
jgi:hypothetical protein